MSDTRLCGCFSRYKRDTYRFLAFFPGLSAEAGADAGAVAGAVSASVPIPVSVSVPIAAAAREVDATGFSLFPFKIGVRNIGFRFKSLEV